MSGLAEEAASVATSLPEASVEALTRLMRDGATANPLVLQHELGLSSHAAATLAAFLAKADEGIGVQAAVMMIRAAQIAARQIIDRQSTVELVWTGPPVPSIAARQTAPALRDIIRAAQREVVLVGYSFSEGARDLIAKLALLAARDVHVWLIAEDPHQLESFRRIIGGRIRVSTMSNSDETTALHAKLTIVDRRQLIITSANFTRRGLQSNIELGALITGPAAADAAELLEHLARQGRVRDVAL